jgi:hypothetical protein
MGKTASTAVLLFSVLLLALSPGLYGQPEGCSGRLELASDENLIAGSPVSFYFTNQGTESITLRSAAPWLVRETAPQGSVIYVPVGAGVIQEVAAGKRYPVSQAWSWTPDRDGEYYIELSYECAGVYPLLTYLQMKVSAAPIREFPDTWLLAVAVAVAVGATLLLTRHRRRQSLLASE